MERFLVERAEELGRDRVGDRTTVRRVVDQPLHEPEDGPLDLLTKLGRHLPLMLLADLTNTVEHDRLGCQRILSQKGVEQFPGIKTGVGPISDRRQVERDRRGESARDADQSKLEGVQKHAVGQPRLAEHAVKRQRGRKPAVQTRRGGVEVGVRCDAHGPSKNAIAFGCQKRHAPFFLLLLGRDSRSLTQPPAEQLGKRLQQELGRRASLLTIAERALGRANDGRSLLVAGLGCVGVEPGPQLGIGAEELGAEVLAETLARKSERFQGRDSWAGARNNTPSGSTAAGSNLTRRFRNDSCSSISLRCSLSRRLTVGGKSLSMPGRNSVGSSY